MRQRSYRATLLAAWLASATLAVPARAAEPAGSPATNRLIAQLASEQFAVRQSAAARLLQRGPAALPAVAAASQSADPEVRLRAVRLRVQLEQRQFDDRLRAFVADETRHNDFAPPGWAAYRRLMADAGASRRIFADIYRSDPELLEAAFGTSTEDASAAKRTVVKLIESRAVLLQNRNKEHRGPRDLRKDTTAPMLALLTVAAAAPESLSERATQLLVQLTRTELGSIARGEHCRGFTTRRLIAAWISRSTTADLYVLSQMLQLADALELRELAPLAIGIATGQRTIRPAHAQFRAAALLMAGKLGDAEDVLLLEPLLEDRAVCASQAGRGKQQETFEDVEVRDVALAVILHLEGKKPVNHGFAASEVHPEKLFVLHSLAFGSHAERERATNAWRADRSTGTEPIRVAQPAAESLIR